MASGESNDLLVVEAHAVEDVTKVLDRLRPVGVVIGDAAVRKTSVRGEALVLRWRGDLFGVGAANTEGDLRTAPVAEEERERRL